MSYEPPRRTVYTSQAPPHEYYGGPGYYRISQPQPQPGPAYAAQPIMYAAAPPVETQFFPDCRTPLDRTRPHTPEYDYTRAPEAPPDHRRSWNSRDDRSQRGHYDRDRERPPARSASKPPHTSKVLIIVLHKEDGTIDETFSVMRCRYMPPRAAASFGVDGLRIFMCMQDEQFDDTYHSMIEAHRAMRSATRVNPDIPAALVESAKNLIWVHPNKGEFRLKRNLGTMYIYNLFPKKSAPAGDLRERLGPRTPPREAAGEDEALDFAEESEYDPFADEDHDARRAKRV